MLWDMGYCTNLVSVWCDTARRNQITFLFEKIIINKRAFTTAEAQAQSLKELEEVLYVGANSPFIYTKNAHCIVEKGSRPPSWV